MIFKQRKIGSFIGMIKIIAGNLSPYASYLSIALMGITSYYTTISPLAAEWGIYLPFWLFVIILMLIISCGGLLEWVYMMLSYYRASNEQAWEAGGPLQDKIASLEKDNIEMKGMLHQNSVDIAEIKRILLDGQRS